MSHCLAGPGPNNFDPLTALGVEAQTDQERQRYAELQVALEAKRAERELAYQNAYTAAWAKLFPGLLPIQGMASPLPVSSSVVPRQASASVTARLKWWSRKRAKPSVSVKRMTLLKIGFIGRYFTWLWRGETFAHETIMA